MMGFSAAAGMVVNQKRVRTVKEGKAENGPIVYWMSRDQRVRDNWALLRAQEEAVRRKTPMAVVFCLVPEFLHAGIRQYGFMLKGLEEVAQDLGRRGVPFYLLTGDPAVRIPPFLKDHDVRMLITDFDPLRIKRQWKWGVAERITIPFYEVDAHNIVPCWIASQKQEYGAYTVRPKIRRLLGEFLEEFPPVADAGTSWPEKAPPIDWGHIRKALCLDGALEEVGREPCGKPGPASGEPYWLKPGEEEGRATLRGFIQGKLPTYDRDRNDPNLDGQSNLSPYLHFGHVSAQRVTLEVRKAGGDSASRDAFLEELIVRRELSDNFCLFNAGYDRVQGFPEWAQRTLNEHRHDNRPYVYSVGQLEGAETHDPLWNAAQGEMVKKGKMHGYLRMYWAKKILEWTASPEQAMEAAIYLNDRYQLDGRDPNGYTGIAWSIGGVHDRAWSERGVFGKIRYMSYNGCRSKFDVQSYIDRVRSM
jgi:deoxyribodipyrimidine photo-lyase